jgi:hypothetical protein
MKGSGLPLIQVEDKKITPQHILAPRGNEKTKLKFVRLPLYRPWTPI